MASSDRDHSIRAFYDREGYYVARGIISRLAIDAVLKCLDRDVYGNAMPLLRHPSVTLEPNAYRTGPNGEPFVANALYNPHLEAATTALGESILDLVCTTDIADLLAAINGESQHTIHQAILFFVPPGTEPHVDGWALDTEEPGELCTLWIPLEPISFANGPVCVFPTPRGSFLTPASLGITDFDSLPPREGYKRYHDALIAAHRERKIGGVVPLLDPGDLLVFSSLTLHGTVPPVSEALTRKALQIILRPSPSRWGGILHSRLKGEFSLGNDPDELPRGARWKLSLSQKRKLA